MRNLLRLAAAASGLWCWKCKGLICQGGSEHWSITNGEDRIERLRAGVV